MPGPKGAKVRNTPFQHFDIICSFIITLKVCHEPFFSLFRAALAEWVEEDLGVAEVIRCGSFDTMNLMIQ